MRAKIGQYKRGVIIPTEEQEQMSLFEWADTQLHDYPELQWLYAIHNGLRLTPGMRVKAKKLGTRTGVADVCLPVRRGHASGLYIELKRRKGGEVSPEQQSFATFVTAQGFCCRVAKGWEQASRMILAYLNERPFDL